MFNRKGFTLVELIIVVIIIGILATIAIPQYLKAVERAKIAKAKAGCGFIVQGEKMRYADKGSYTSVIAELDDYVEMSNITADPDWSYSANATNSDCTASRSSGNYTGQTVTLRTSDGTWQGNHPLR